MILGHWPSNWPSYRLARRYDVALEAERNAGADKCHKIVAVVFQPFSGLLDSFPMLKTFSWFLMHSHVFFLVGRQFSSQDSGWEIAIELSTDSARSNFTSVVLSFCR